MKVRRTVGGWICGRQFTLCLPRGVLLLIMTEESDSSAEFHNTT